MRIFAIICIFCISTMSLSAWTGLIASPWDVLDSAKWNEMVAVLENKTQIDDANSSASDTWSSQKISQVMGVNASRIELAAQNTLNSSTNYTSINLASASIDDIGISMSGNTITLPAWTYQFTLDMGFTTNAQRTNIGFWAYVNGSLYSESFGSNYIRVQNGHNEASSVFTDIFETPTPGTLSFSGKRLANAGTVTTNLGASRILIQKLK